MSFERGSEWRRWDLHIHTPETKKNDRFEGDTIDEKWDKFYDSINTYISDGSDPRKSVAVIAITDYLSIDNYKKVIADNRLTKSIYLVLPNVEMRVQPIANDTHINIHFIFNPVIIDEIESRFFSKLFFKCGDTNFSASHSELIRLGKTMDASLDDEMAYIKGIEQFVPSFDAITKVFSTDHQLRENTIVLVSNSSNDGVSGACNHSNYLISGNRDSQLKAFRQSIYKFVDGIFSSTPSNIEYFLGKKESCPEELVVNECGSLKPCVHGCDAHENSKIFEPDFQKYCWIKADPTFNGLKQIVYEPEERVCISESVPDYKQAYYTIDRIEFDDPDFQKAPVLFNENLTCVIGGKSTGKSILLHNLASFIDRNQVKEKEVVSKTTTKNVLAAKVVWGDGKSDSERKIVYIPQTYLNRLSDENEYKTEIDSIIEDVVLIDEEIKKSHQKMFNFIKALKRITNQTILDLLSVSNEVNSIRGMKKELGIKSGIEEEIQRLSNKKSEISKDLNLSDEEISAFENAVKKEKVLLRETSAISEEIEKIQAIDTVVSPKYDEQVFSDATKELLASSVKRTIEEADEYWKEEKKKLIDNLKDALSEKNEEIKKCSQIEILLKDKVSNNKQISELSSKIQKEVDKLEKFNNLERQEEELLEKEELLINELSNSKCSFKSIFENYANIVNSASTLTGNDLEFSVIVPFKKDTFVDRMSAIFNNRTIAYKELSITDEFNETDYTVDWIKNVITNVLNKSLQTKNGFNRETALREVLSNWYGIKYNIKMDNDTIDVMSPGKKALVLLNLLIDLAESKCPILIDQPEDDLDNRSIFEDLIPFIKKKKKDRQIIIVTHNANVVLGADAEEVIVANQNSTNSPNKEFRFEYRSGSIENDSPNKNAEGEIKRGILNSQGLQQHICDILEGGAKAFELRKNKYHI